jgi:hypothetical protein
MTEAMACHGAVHVETMEDVLAQMIGALSDPQGTKPILTSRKPREKVEDTS